MAKEYPITGAGENTPSIPYYFSWINNTNEGSTERQTLINLEFFRYMKETYGMQIRIYAWDAGNFDGASHGYGDLKGEKFRSQYPEGYQNVVAKAASLGIRFGLWGSPDGFGDTPEEEKERVDFYVHLCRDYHFAAFKLDGVCGQLRPEKAGTYARMIEECRKYSPDLILLNHRLDFYEAQKYITTFLWNGDETYTDVHAHNRITAPHHRAYTFTRGNVTNEKGELIRLAEDHGVCLSSALDYFEDDLVYQAFGRCLIAAPEIYGNPWLLKDSELPRLARIYNLRARWAEVLVNGMKLPPELGANAVARGTGNRRMICTGNDTWETKTISLPLDGTIGLDAQNGPVRVIQRFPFDKDIGEFEYEARVNIDLPPFRAALFEISAGEYAPSPVLSNCEYEVIRERHDEPEEVRIVKSGGGEVYLLNEIGDLLYGGEPTLFCTTDPVDIKERPPVYLGALTDCVENPENGEALYEAAMFAVDNDSLEAQCLKRSGLTRIPAVQAARDAFFAQATYRLRGCEAAALFDGDEKTFFDGQSRNYCDNVLRIDGGCLRIDLGETVEADEVLIECFSIDEPTHEVPAQLLPEFAEYSETFADWRQSGKAQVADCGKLTQKIVRFCVHTLYEAQGSRLRVSYPIGGKLRYLRIAEPMDRIFSVTVLKDGAPVKLHHPSANNMQAHYSKKRTKLVKTAEFTVPEHREGSYLALGVNGDHGAEGVYCTAEIDGVLMGFEDRAPSYKSNVWEHKVCDEPLNNTFYFTLPESSAGKKIRLFASFSTEKGGECDCRVYLCERHG